MKTIAEQLRESRSKHTLTSYDDAVRQLRAFKAVQPVTWKRSVYPAPKATTVG